MLNLNHFLEAGGVSATASIKLLRHTPKEGDAEEAWRSGWLHEYERMHAGDFRIPEFFATFIPFVRGVRFLWVKRIVGQLPRSAEPLASYPFQDHYEMAGLKVNLERMPSFDTYEGRAIFEWNRGIRGYDVWHDHTRPSPLTELLAPNALDSFRGYGQVFLTIHHLRDLFTDGSNADWRAALRAVSGVYLITDMNDGALYVGSAYGAEGFLGRFETYAKGRGHGNNALLRRRLDSDANALEGWRWSILDTMPTATTAVEVIAQEQFQKIRLGTRAHGLNAN